jgi:hypothetical protein
MSFIGNAFTMFLQRVSPPETQIAAAQRSNNALRAYLQNDTYFGPQLLDAFLNGSYARHTVVQPIKDVDIIVVVGTDWLDGDPGRAMESLRSKLAQRYDGYRTRRQRRAVKISLSDMTLDVVLAVAPNGLQRPLHIPDREARRWIETHPKRQLELVKALRARTNNNYSRLVRLAKAWAKSRVAAADRPSSFVLECAVYHVTAASPGRFAGPIDEAFAALLQDLYAWDAGRRGNLLSWGHPTIVDPALPAVNVAARWDSSGADRFKEKLKRAVRHLEGVHRSRWDETEVRHWRDLFGAPFPAPSTVARRVRERT